MGLAGVSGGLDDVVLKDGEQDDESVDNNKAYC